MSKREVGSLACKLLGIYMIMQGLNVLANVVAGEFVSDAGLAEFRNKIINFIRGTSQPIYYWIWHFLRVTGFG